MLRRGLCQSLGLVALAMAVSRADAQSSRDTTSLPCRTLNSEARCAPQSVSIVQLIATPERFDGKRVKFIGFVHMELESSEVYLHREDSEHRLVSNGVYVDLREEWAKHHTALNDRYVLLEGTFRAQGGGKVSGALVDVTGADVWPWNDSAASRARGFKVLKAAPKVAPTAKP